MYNRFDFSHERELSYEELEKRVEAYYPEANLNTFKKAFYFAKKAHAGQKRSSGEDYFIHPCNVAAVLIKLKVDMDGLVAGLLHDVVEDCGVSPEDIGREFSPAVAQIVLGLTKISQIKFKTKEEFQVENFRKMIVATAEDLRVIIVKLADRMHNMRTLQYIGRERQKKVAQETLDIYVPLAGRLGMGSIKSELEDLCLRFLHPEVYYRLAEKTAENEAQRNDYIVEAASIIKEKLLEYSIKAEIEGRPKHFYSLFKRMNDGEVAFEQIQDLLAFKVIVGNITECYKVLGIIHSRFIPIPGRFKDYIAIPKVNGYQSLHTTAIGPNGQRIEIQIRTLEMDETAEVGLAAHWKYRKEGEGKNPSWLQDLLEFNKDMPNAGEFISAVKHGLDMDEVFVFTPKGDVKELAYGATPLDLAYAIHTDIGHKTVGAKVNGKMAPLKYTLQSGDTVEILTKDSQFPRRDWFKMAKTSRAKTKIKQWLLKSEREKSKARGLNVLKRTQEEGPIIVPMAKNVAVRQARCCRPIPGDMIVGHIRKGRGITVHTADCEVAGRGGAARIVAVEWNHDFKAKHPANIRVIAHDRPGILSVISKEINRAGINIRSASAKSTLDRKGSFLFELEVSDQAELLGALSAIESLPEVISVVRS